MHLCQILLAGMCRDRKTGTRSARGRRHIDGTWRSADEVPRAPDGRPESHVALNGHGSYPYPGTTIRLFGAFNDQTSRDGAQPVFASYEGGCEWIRLLGNQGLAPFRRVPQKQQRKQRTPDAGSSLSMCFGICNSCSRGPPAGKVWAPQVCVLVTSPGKLPSVQICGTCARSRTGAEPKS